MASEPLNVLVVEDEYFIAAELAELLRKHRFNVLGPTASIREARKLIATLRPDCAVLDLNLNGDLTFAFAATLKDDAIPVIIVTGYDRKHIPASLHDIPIFQKPFIAIDLLESIRRLAGT